MNDGTRDGCTLGGLMDGYSDFLARKSIAAVACGFDLPLESLNAQLFDFQAVLVRWALKRGRAALFADTGQRRSRAREVKAQEIRESDGFDSLGRARFKLCPDRGAQVGRTLSRCPCGREFIGRNKARELRKEAGEPIRRGRKAKPRPVAPKPEAQLLALAEPKMQIPEAARFVVSRTPEGGLQLHWPDFNVKFTLTAGERMIVRSVV